MNDNLFFWVELSNNKSWKNYESVVNCIGNQIDCLIKSRYFGEKRKIELIERVLYLYCDFENNPMTKSIRKKLEKTLNKPSVLTNDMDPYYEYFIKAWNKFDKIPYSGFSTEKELDFFKELKENVVISIMNKVKYTI